LIDLYDSKQAIFERTVMARTANVRTKQEQNFIDQGKS